MKAITLKKSTYPPKPNGGAVALIDDIIARAVKLRASDIHLEPQDGTLRVRYRVDGLLQDGIHIHKSMQAAAISRVKVMVDLDIAEHRLPQDGRTHLKIDGQDIDLRVSSIPTAFGEKIVMRLLNRSQALLTLEELGMEREDLKTYKALVSKPHGIILVTGPTGSGKTTTLYATLSQINSSKINIVTIEDPIEYQLPGINQMQANYKAGLTFAKGLRSILRQDPDVIMVGEIRDLETARIAIQAAMTGHLVFSTLHTNDAAGAIARLSDMGIEPYLIAASLSGVVAQRLARKICCQCGGRGCKQCGLVGYYGRTGIYEILKISEEIKNLIFKRASASTIRETAVKQGMRTLKVAGEAKVMQGITTKEEVMCVVYLDN